MITKHWGVVITDANNAATLYHASNVVGPWQFIVKPVGDPGKSLSLIVLVKVGTVTKNGISAVIQQIPADGKASKRNGEAFSCRTWVKDALAHLVAKGNVVLKDDVGKCRLCVYILVKGDMISIVKVSADTGSQNHCKNWPRRTVSSSARRLKREADLT